MWKRLKKRFAEHRYTIAVVGVSRKLILPGFDKMPLYDVLLFFVQGMQKGAVSMRAAAIAFNFFLAIFPAILFFFTIIPYLPIENFQTNLQSTLQELIPASTFETIWSTVEDIVIRKRGGLLSLGFVMALYFSTNGIRTLIMAFNQSVLFKEKRPAWKIRITSFALVVELSVIIIIAILLIIKGSEALVYLREADILHSELALYGLQLLRWLVIIGMIFFVISSLYYYAPARAERFRFISAGSTLATALSIGTSVGFDYYVDNFSRYNALYGSIGTLIVILLWLYLNAMILLIGFELNASIRNARAQESGQQ